MLENYLKQTTCKMVYMFNWLIQDKKKKSTSYEVIIIQRISIVLTGEVIQWGQHE